MSLTIKNPPTFRNSKISNNLNFKKKDKYNFLINEPIIR